MTDMEYLWFSSVVNTNVILLPGLNNFLMIHLQAFHHISFYAVQLQQFMHLNYKLSSCS